MQKIHKKVRSPKSTRLAVLALFVLAFSLILGKSISFLQSFNKPVDLITQKNYNWDGKSSLNLVYLSNKDSTPQIAVLTLDPNEKKSTVLLVPNKAYAKLPGDLGWWEVGSIYKLGQEDSSQKGANLLKKSLANMFGLPMDGIIIRGTDQQADDFINSLKSNPLNWLAFTKDIKTDLSPSEILILFKSLSKVRADRLVFLNLEKSDITKSKLLGDSSRVLGVDSVKLDLYSRQNLADSTIAEEGKSIAVFNGTNHPGFAAEVARIITNMGGNVIITASTGEIVNHSGVYLQEKAADGITRQRLVQIFAPHCKKEKCETVDPRITHSRAQINLVLGEDYYKLWYE